MAPLRSQETLSIERMAMQWEPRTSSEPLYGSFVDADRQPRDVAHTRAEEARSSRRCAEAEEEGDDDAGAVATLGGGEIGAPPSRRRRTGPLLFVAGALFAGAVFALSGSRGTTRAADADGAVEEDNALSRAAAALRHAAAGVGHAFGGNSHGVGHPRGKPTTQSPTPRPPPTQSPSISMSPTAAPPSPAPTAAMPTPSPSHAIAPLPTRKGLHPAPTTPHRTGSPTRTPVDDSVALVPLRLYKRTFVSTHARNDERFFERVLGIATVHNYTYHAGYNRWRTSADGIENGEDGSGKWTCAQRIEMSALAYQVCVSLRWGFRDRTRYAPPSSSGVEWYESASHLRRTTARTRPNDSARRPRDARRTRARFQNTTTKNDAADAPTVLLFGRSTSSSRSRRRRGSSRRRRG